MQKAVLPMIGESNTLLALNPFLLEDNGVYRLDVVSKVPAQYSDGSANEQAVMDIVKRSKDVSSCPPELERAWSNWAQEAHLSPNRINLVAGLDWRKAGRVLEIGCGCGALTRYLGEQGLIVDALDVSPQRAAIARERCRDLDNVKVLCANLNDLNLPDGRYDYVLLVGVLEYTARFSGAKKPVEQLNREILQRCLSAITREGAVFIAIENRLGFKYIAGACEDHYGVPRVGLYRYPAYDCEWSKRKSEIYTLDYQQWRRLLDSIIDSDYRFFFPFPDYKLPQVILDEDFAQKDPYSYQVLSRIRSRDYCADWSPPLDEYLYWQIATQCDQLHKTSNSFGILLGRQRDSLQKLMPYDFIRFANLKRKRKYRISTFKVRQQTRVIKHYISAQLHDDPAPVVEHRLGVSTYVSGKLLSDIWVEALSSLADVGILMNFLDEYYRFLVMRSEGGTLTGSDIDLLVFNLIVDENQHWHAIDIEWEWKRRGEISVDFVMFRSLLYFAYVHGDAVANCVSDGSIISVKDFVEFGFRHLKLDFSGNQKRYHAMENEFQSAALNDWAYQSVDTIQSHPLAVAHRVGLPKTSIDVYWKSPNQVFSAENSVSQEFNVRPGRLKYRIDLPELSTDLKELRIDPVDHRLTAGYRVLEIPRLRLIGEYGVRDWTTPVEILQHAAVLGLHRMHTQSDEWFVSSIDPQIAIDQKELTSLGRIRAIEIELYWPGRCFQDEINQRLKEENDKLMQLV